LRLWSRLEI